MTGAKDDTGGLRWTWLAVASMAVGILAPAVAFVSGYVTALTAIVMAFTLGFFVRGGAEKVISE